MNLIWDTLRKHVPLGPTIGMALVWLALMLAYTPVADKLATRWARKPPTLELFRGLQQSRAKLILGIIIAWILGGFLEELAFRGVVLQWVKAQASTELPVLWATAIAIMAAALGAGLFHLYQGFRAVITITQLSVLFGLLFVVSGYNFWAVVLCHGFYDTVAFIRFAQKKSRYSRLDNATAS